MKFIPFYKEELHCNNEDEVFEYLVSNLKPSNLLWSYFVNWRKVFSNTREIEITLNLLNYLIGKQNFDEEFTKLVKEHPVVIGVIPALVVRNGNNDKRFKIVVDQKNKRLTYEDFDFTTKDTTESDIRKYLQFIDRTGLKNLFTSKKLKNLVDYMIGVEAGIDSNARKNRGGKAMEDLVEVFIKDFCKQRDCKYLKEANSKKIFQEYGIDVPVDKSSRRYDFVINIGNKVVLIETNFYGGGGSKLKSTAGEYRNLFDVLEGKYKFIWITDGLGWNTTSRSLRETFDHNDYVISLNMLENEILESII